MGAPIIIDGQFGVSTIESNVIRNNISTGGNRVASAIHLDFARNTIIQNNKIHNNQTAACGAVYISGLSFGVVLSQNIIENNIGVSAGGFCVDTTLAFATVSNNVFFNNRLIGAPPNESGSNVRYITSQTESIANFYNNIFYSTSTQPNFYCSLSSGSFGSPIVGNNLFYNPNSIAFGGLCADQIGQNGNILEDPLFIDAQNSNFRLRSGSLAIDAGSNANTSLVDFDGITRPLDGDFDTIVIADIGSFEFNPNGLIMFGEQDLVVSESSSSISIPVCRNEGLSGDVSVTYSTQDVTAVEGVNYSSEAGLIAFSDNESGCKTFDVAIFDNNSQQDLIFDVTLSNTSGGATIGLPNPVSVLINTLPTSMELFPLIPGTTLNYLVNSSIQESATVLAQSNFNGVQAFGVEDNEGDIEYYTNDSNGLFDYGSFFPLDNLTTIASPPLKFLNAQPQIGHVINQNGILTLTNPAVGSFSLNYTFSSIVQAIETITVPFGTYDALKVDLSLQASGFVNGQFIDVSQTTMYWLAAGIGPIRSVATQDGVSEISELVSIQNPPVIVLPSDGATLSGSSVTVTWDAMGVVPPNWAVNAGTSPGAFNLAASGALPSNATQVTLNNLPTNGQPIYIQLYNNASGGYTVVDENMYIAFDPSSTPSVTINANPSAIAPGETATLTWDSSNVDSCTASGDWNGVQALMGTASTGVLNIANTYTYTLTCSGANGSASDSATVTVAVNTEPQILLPADGATLSGSSVTVTWDAMGVVPPNWAVNAGTSPGAFNLAASGALPSNATQVTLNNLPTNGQPIYIQLYNNASGGYTVVDENMYIAFDPSSTPSVTINANPSAIAPGETATLTWDSSNVDSCTASGDWNGVQALMGTASTGVLNIANTYTYTLTCSGANGSASDSATVTVAVNTEPQILLPADGATLSGSSVTVTWDAMGVVPPNWAVNAGTSPGAFNLAASGALPSNATQVTLNNLPTNGQPIYIQLYNNASGGYTVVDENMYIAFDPSSTPSVTINANPSAIAPGETATLTWDSSNVDSCTASGDWNGVQALMGTASTGVLNIANTYTYTLTCSGANGSASDSATVTVAVNTEPQILLPADGATLSGSSVTVTWDAMGVVPPNWAVNAGTSPGAFNLAASGALPSNATQVTLNNLPTNGQPIYIQLYNNASGGYTVVDENMYIAFDPSSTPSVTINANPSAIAPGETATLTWDSSNVDSCTASGDWNGVQALMGTASTGVLNIANTYTYTLTCSGANGSASDSATVTVAVNTEPQILLPADGATLSGSSVTVTWDAMGVVPPNWAVNAGTSPGAFNLAASGALPSNATQVTLNNLPTNGQPIYIQLYNNASGGYTVVDENMYIAFDPSSTPSVTINANPSAIAPGETATLRGTVLM